MPEWNEETLADIQHDIWAHWMHWFFENDTPENRERWKSQMNTPFADLSEREKESDRKVVRQFLAAALEEIDRLKGWVNDLQAGMYINCVYCGHRYGPDDEVPATMAEVLKEHIRQCPKHPLHEAEQRIKELEGVLREVRHLQWVERHIEWDHGCDQAAAIRQLREQVAAVLSSEGEGE